MAAWTILLAVLAGCTGSQDLGVQDRPGSVHWVELQNDARAGLVTVEADGQEIARTEAPLGASDIDLVLGCPPEGSHLDFLLEGATARLDGALCQAGSLLRIAFSSNGASTAFVA